MTTSRFPTTRRRVSMRPRQLKPWMPAFFLLSFVVSCGGERWPSEAGDSLQPIERKGSMTAKYRYDQVAAAAKALDNTLKFRAVRSRNVSANGTSPSWSYEFGMTIPPYDHYYFTATYDSVSFDSTSGATVGSAFITHAWMNSSEALTVAEGHGGRAFRSSNPDVTIQASLGEAVVPDPVTCWYIVYRSTVNSMFMHVSIDATTGAVVDATFAGP